MTLRVEDRIHPTVPRRSEAVAKQLLNARLAHASIEIACDDDGRCRPGNPSNGSHHVPRARGAHVAVASVAVPTVNAPVGVEHPERATTGRLPQLHPIHVARAPFS